MDLLEKMELYVINEFDFVFMVEKFSGIELEFCINFFYFIFLSRENIFLCSGL